MSDPRASQPAPPNEGFRGLRYVWGKLVDEKGTILKGFEHSCTGRSAAMPPELDELCRPVRFGVGDRSELLWRDSPWRQTGGFAVRPVVCNQKPWVLAVRLVQRPEAAENSRRYTEAHYLAGSADAYDYDSPRRISEALDVTPLRALDMSLPPVVLPPGNRRANLPSDWLVRVEALVRPILSSVPVNEVFGAVAEQQLVDDIECLLAAVPLSLRWRLSIGIGTTTVDDDLAIALSVQRGSGLSRSQLAGTTLDLSSGTRYLEWLRRHCDDCQTFGELVERVAVSLPEHASPSAFPPDASWGAVSAAVVRATVKPAGVRVQTDLPPPSKAEDLPDLGRIEDVLQQFERLKPSEAIDALELAESCLPRGASVRPVYTLLSSLAALRAGSESLPELSRGEARILRRLATPMKVAPETLSRTNSEPLLRLAAQRWPAEARPFSLTSQQLETILEEIASNGALRHAWGKILRIADWTHHPGWRWVALEAVAADQLEETALHALSGRTLARLIASGASLPPTAIAKIVSQDVFDALPPLTAIDAIYLSSVGALLSVARNNNATPLLDGLAMTLARTLELDETDVELLSRARSSATDHAFKQQAEDFLRDVIAERKPADVTLYARSIVRGAPP